MIEPSNEEKVAQAKFIHEQALDLIRRFQARGVRVADLIWLMAVLCETFIRSSNDEDDKKVLKNIRIRTEAMLSAGVRECLVNRLFIDKTIQDLSGGGADFEEFKSPFKA